MSLDTRPLIIAHRGASKEAPENTLAAFALALELGCTGIELDVHVSADGALIVCHDAEVDRTTDGSGKIAEMTVAELKRLDAGRWFDVRYAGQRLPLLEEVLDLVPPSVPLNIEIKSSLHPDVNRLLLSLLRERNRLNSVFVSSFDFDVLFALQRLEPAMRIGLLYDAEAPDYRRLASERGVRLYSLHAHHSWIVPAYVEEAKRAGLAVYPWTIDAPDRMREALAAGVSGIISNDVRLLKEAVESLG
mgnify:CR=1 FL=1